MNIGREDGQHPLRPETRQSDAAQEDDRSLAAALRETARSIGGLLFFVVAVLLLLHGTRFI
jgi:hypothetical protein